MRSAGVARRAGRFLVYALIGLAAVLWGAFWLAVLLTIPLRATGTVKTYVVRSSAMEPTMHCGRPHTGCEGAHNDRFAALTRFVDYDRGDIVVFETPPRVARFCGVGGIFVKRIVGLPGERIQHRLLQGRDVVYVDGRKLEEPYVEADRRGFGPEKTFEVPKGQYYVLGDNRASSCDSSVWGALPREDLIGEVVLNYWPPGRISFR